MKRRADELMEVKIIELTKNKAKIEIVGEDHTLANLITKTLLEDPAVRLSTYIIEHPLISHPVITVVTDGNKSPIEAIKDAVSKIKGLIGEFRAALNQALKEEGVIAEKPKE